MQPGDAWVFTRTAHLTWEWTRPDGSRSLALFPTLEAATMNAGKHGFDPLKQCWIAVDGERKTRYRPSTGSDRLSVSASQAPQRAPVTENEGTTATNDLSSDWAYQMAATMVINLMRDHPQLNKLGAIKVAWGALKDTHPHQKDQFESVEYVAETVRAIREIVEGRKRSMLHPDAEELARSRLQLPQRAPQK